MKRFVLSILFGIIGISLGIAGGYWSSIGFSNAWKKLPEAPLKIDLIAISEENEIIVHTFDNDLYTYNERSQKWEKATVDDPTALPQELESCDYSSQAFSLLAFAPQNIEQCFQFTKNYIDGYNQTIIALESTGQIWIWQVMRNPYKAIAEQICYPGVGLFMGLFVGFLVGSIKRSDNKHALQEENNNG